MKITHPVEGYNGHVRVADRGFHFLAGVTHAKAKDIPDRVRAQLEEAGFDIVDPRRQHDDDDEPPAGDAPPAGDHPPVE